MKRILKAGILGTAVSMFFTGCGSSSLTSGQSGGYKQAAQEVIQTQENREQWGEAGLKEGETLQQKEAPDYYEENEENKFENLSGTAAFRIKETHSQETNDLESFEVSTLLEDGTFLYSYTTRVGVRDETERKDNRKKVHCAAAYNYKTQNFKVIHEEIFTEKENESFYMQVCGNDGTGDIFVYDNGYGWLYDCSGKLKLHTDIETFVWKHFKGHSITVTEAFTDGSNRIYVNLVIEINEIEDVQDNSEDISEDNADKKAEELEKKMSENTQEVVLVYDILEYSSSIDQENLKFDEQVKNWKNMYSGAVGEIPSAEEDWKKAVTAVPAEWGPAFLWGLSRTPVYQWNNKDSEEFGHQDNGVSDFIPVADSYKAFTGLKNNMVLQDENLFVLHDNKYYKIYGTVLNDLGEGDYNKSRFKRTIEKVETTTNEDGTTEETHISVEQELEKGRNRDAFPKNSYLEGYSIQNNCNSVLTVIDDTVFAILEKKEVVKNTLLCLEKSGTSNEICEFATETMVDVVKENETLYLIASLKDGTAVWKLKDSDNGKVLGANDCVITNDQLRNVIKEVAYRQSDVDNKYHTAYGDMTKDKSGVSVDANAGMLLNGSNLLHVNLKTPQTELLKKIEKNEKIMTSEIKNVAGSNDLSKVQGNGYLLATLTDGLIYFDIGTKRAICLDAGTWYSIWKMGDTFVAVGFESSDTNFDSLDIAHARAKELNVDNLYKTGLEKILRSANSDALADKKEDNENTKKMKEEYEKNYKDANVEFVRPEDGKDVLEAWKNNNPGDIIKQKQSKEASEAAKSE